MSEQKQIQGWRDIQITPDMPVSVIVNFLNVLNQRLCAIENEIVVDFEGSKKTLTEVYAIQSMRETEAMANKAEEPRDNPEHLNNGD